VSTEKFEDKVIIAGMGQTEIGRRVPRSSLDLTVEACLAAVADAGLTCDDIDGLVSWPGDVGYTGGVTAASPGFGGPSTPLVKEALGLRLNWHFAGPEGPAMLGSVVNGAMAVASGLCDNLIVFRTMTEASAQAGGGRQGYWEPDDNGVSGYMQWHMPFGGLSGANWMAPFATRYFHDFGAGREQLAHIALNARRNAALNPKAVYRSPMSLDDYMNVRMITSPLCLYDCDVPIDASTAFVLSRRERAADLDHPAVRLEAVGTAIHGRASWDQRADLTTMAAHDAGAHLWSRTTLRPGDVDVGGVYDGFSILTLLWLEGLQFCGHGEAADFVSQPGTIELGGSLPISTGGGQLSEGRLHSFGHLHEVCLQLRGEADGRQVQGAEVGVVSSGAGPLASCMLLTRG
jgi:acetyl-CoA acetyltransferase